VPTWKKTAEETGITDIEQWENEGDVCTVLYCAQAVI